MEKSEALGVLQALADGIDPNTGENFPDNSPYQHPRIIRALFVANCAIEALLAQEQQGRSKKNRVTMDSEGSARKMLPINAGRAWTTKENQELIAAFEQGISAKELAKRHQRTEGAILSRLIRLGKIPVDGMNPLNKTVESSSEDETKEVPF